MRLNRLSFALLLPALEIAVWLILVPTQTGLIYWRLLQLNSPASAFITIAPGAAVTIKRPESGHPLFDLALRFSTFPKGDLITAINVPGVFVEALVSLPTTWPDSWHPATLSKQDWRAVVLPLYCLPFWWFVGMGVDTALGRRRLRWGWLLLGTISFLLMATLLIGLRFGMTEAERGETRQWVLSGFCFWTIAFSTFPIAWILQRKRSTAAKLTTQSE